ncbi:MAG: hypothetical protein Alis3KO_30360 [Aliiglaciecola sp.]
MPRFFIQIIEPTLCKIVDDFPQSDPIIRPVNVLFEISTFSEIILNGLSDEIFSARNGNRPTKINQKL